MAWSLIANTLGTAGAPAGGTATTSAVDTTGASLLIIIAADFNFDSSTDFVFDSKGNSWHALQVRSNTGDNAVAIWYAWDHGGSPLSVGAGHTFSAAGSYVGMCAGAFGGGLTGSDPYDGNQNGNVGSGTTIQPGSVTPAVNNSLIITGFAMPNIAATTCTINSSYLPATPTQIAFVSGNNVGSALAYLIEGAAAATNPTWTSNNSGLLAAVIACFKPSVAPTDPPYRPDTSIPQGYLPTVVLQ